MIPVVFLGLICIAFSQTFVGPQWQGLSASMKVASLDPSIKNNTTPGSFPTVGLAELFIESMDTTFDYVGDDMPAQFLSRRQKLIHSVAVIMDTKWVPRSNPYTGVFQGCDHSYARLSLAHPPLNIPKPYAPGLSFKCLRDGVPSANLFAMYSLEGQVTYNFFAHDLTNHVPAISSSADFALQQIVKTFAKASNFPVMIGLHDMAQLDQHGKNITAPKFPFRLIFHPTTALHKAFPDTPSQDAFEYVLARGLASPQTLYEIYAQDKPNDPPSAYLHIGSLVSTSPATTSNFGDVYMFFQHTRMEGDFVFRPDWKQAAIDIMHQQQNTPYFTFPDLPFN